MIRVEGERFVDPQGRTLLLRGANVGGNAKLPGPDGSFVGRPFPLAEADDHFARLARWGLTVARLVVTWEAVERLGPRHYDTAYLDYLEALIHAAARHGIDVFVDFHQDVWSRFTGGDGAPEWTLHAAGFDVGALVETGAAVLETSKKMVWPTNATKLGAATMFTLFFGGETFAPNTRIDGVNAQRFLQEHFFGAVEQVVRRVGALPNVFGVDVWNEPFAGFIGWEDLERPAGPVEMGAMPSPLQAMALGMGHPVDVKVFHRGLFGPRVTGTRRLNPNGRRVWREGSSCPWLAHGVWSDGPPRLTAPKHFVRGTFAKDFLMPFLVEAAARIHRRAPHLAVMLQGVPFQEGPGWAGSRPCVWAPHWYDGYVLFLKDFRSYLAADAFTQKPVFGAGRIRKSFARQLGRLADEARARQMPVVIGELGIAFDLRGDARAAMNRTLTAVEDAGVGATLWNYCADHTEAGGDGWNGEDLSIYSRTSAEPDGGRALEAVVRPRAVAIAGTLVRSGFDLRTRRFELVVRPDPALTAPTQVFLPALHYPRGVHAVASAGTFADGKWTHAGATEQTLTVLPAR